MNCSTAQSIIQDYLDRRLVVLDRNEFVRHVSDCKSCGKELAFYRDVYGFLGEMEREQVPRGFQNKVISQLKAERIIHRPDVPALRRFTGAFLALPAMAKYPLAATAVIAALYFPLLLILGNAKGIAVKATVFMTDVFLILQNALGGVSFLANISDTLGRYAKLGKTVVGACLSLVASAGDNVLVLSIAVVAALMAVLAVSILRKKRSSHNAPFSI